MNLGTIYTGRHNRDRFVMKGRFDLSCVGVHAGGFVPARAANLRLVAPVPAETIAGLLASACVVVGHRKQGPDCVRGSFLIWLMPASEL